MTLLLARLMPVAVVLLLACGEASAHAPHPAHWPSAEQWLRVLSLRDHNTRVVVGGTALLGMAAGVIGSFALLRKRALMGDALSHATLPGIGLAFTAATAAGATQKALPVLLLGAAVTGALGVGVILFLRRHTRLKEDAALGVVLSVFFGAGIAVLGIVQQLGTGSAAGLESFIYGKTASMVPSDVALIAAAAALVLIACALLFKEFRLVCFDPAYAAAQGLPVLWLDLAMMGLVAAVTVIGLQAVGLILVIALLIIPAAAARFWTERVLPMTLASAAIGAASATAGAVASALWPRLPSGAMIVLVAAALFAVSMAVAPARGLLPRELRRANLARRVGQRHLLRAVYELLEAAGTPDAEPPQAVAIESLMHKRSWSRRHLARLVRQAEHDGLLVPGPAGGVLLTDRGLVEARRATREHRLWEMYLVTHADIAPSHVDTGADAIEHVLHAPMIARLEALVEGDRRLDAEHVPQSPHPIPLPR